MTDNMESFIKSILPEMVELRHDLHRHPELAYQEKRTSGRLESELRKIPDLEIKTGLAETGIIATLTGNRQQSDRCVALRSDIDALPVSEANDFEYRSEVPGTMHACGHDGHMTCLIGAVKTLAACREQFEGKIRFVFQPAEESGAGGRRMVEEGALDDPPAQAAFAMHGWPECRLGSIMIGTGPILAAATSWNVRLKGKGAHAAYPHQGTDVILAASHIVNKAQILVSRRRDPVRPAALSVCSIHAGDAHNVLPEECMLKGTVRGLDQGTHDGIIDGLRRIVEHEATEAGIEAEFEKLESYPSLVNDAQAAELVRSVAETIFGMEHVETRPTPSLGGEDFAFFANRVPAAMWRAGLRLPGQESCPKLHQPNFDFPDAAIPIGIQMHARIALRFLESGLPS